jgi:PucR C-terminal helix-turn-helix domain/GGDEF-like domain
MSTPGRDLTRRRRAVLAPELAEVAGLVVARLPDLIDRVVQRVLAEIEFYRGSDAVGLDDLRDSVRSNLESMAGQLTTDQPPDLSAPHATGRQRARQGVPLADILHAYRIGFTELWEAIVQEARRDARTPSETLVDAASGVWWLIGEYTQELTVAYREAAAELLLAGARERAALVEALFTGGIPDRDTLWEAAKLLRLPWEGVFVVVAVEAPGLAKEGLPDAEAFLAGRGIGSAWQLHPDTQMGVVSLRRLDTLPLLLELLGRGVRARAGVSPVYRSLGDTPRALHYARLVLASQPAGRRAVAQFEQTPLRVLAAAAPDAAAELARTVLGGVLDLPAQERSSLLGTLQAWFDAGGSAVETGKRIYCHPNTVRYRLRRLQEHTGRSLDDPRAVAELLAALDALRLARGTDWSSRG